MKVQTKIELLLTYDNTEVGDPGFEWDWTSLLNADGDSKVEVEILESTTVWRAGPTS